MNKIHYIQTEYRFDLSQSMYSKDSADPVDTFQQLYEAAKKKFSKSCKPNSDVLFNQIRASHFGYMNNNYAVYNPETGDSSAKSFYAPYQKPILLNHDSHSDPIGRITSATYVPFDISLSQSKNVKTPKGVVLAHGFVSDKAAVEKIMDGRYLTVSVGFTAKSVKCSICGNEPYTSECDHYRGETYDGKLCYYIMSDLDYREVSYVTVPADQGKSHYAGVTNYELVCNSEDQLNDKDYIINNMLTSNENELYQDSGVTLFIAQDTQNHVPRGKGFHVFSSNDSAVENNIITKTWSNDLHFHQNSGLYIPLNAAHINDDHDATLTSQDETSITEPTDKTTSRKESMMEFDFSKVSCADALEKVPGLREHLDQLAAKKNADAIKDANEAKAALAGKDEEIKTLKTEMDALAESAKTIALDSIMTLMAKLEKPQYMTIVTKNKDSQEQLTAELKEFSDRFATRTLKSLEDTVADLKLELDAKMALDATSKSDETQQTSIDSAPAGKGITTTTIPSTTPQNNQDSIDSNTRKRKASLFG